MLTVSLRDVFCFLAALGILVIGYGIVFYKENYKEISFLRCIKKWKRAKESGDYEKCKKLFKKALKNKFIQDVFVRALCLDMLCKWAGMFGVAKGNSQQKRFCEKEN